MRNLKEIVTKTLTLIGGVVGGVAVYSLFFVNPVNNNEIIRPTSTEITEMTDYIMEVYEDVMEKSPKPVYDINKIRDLVL